MKGVKMIVQNECNKCNKCNKCDGFGTIKCEDCKGTGVIPQKEYKITVVSNNDEVSEEIMQKIQDFAMALRKQNKDRASILVSIKRG